MQDYSETSIFFKWGVSKYFTCSARWRAKGRAFFNV